MEHWARVPGKNKSRGTMRRTPRHGIAELTAMPLGRASYTKSHSSGRPSLRPGTPGRSEEPHPQAGTRAYL